MTRRASFVLIASGAWALFVWLTRLVNMAGENRSAGFYVVHSVLALVSIAFGLVVASIGWKVLRRPERPDPAAGGPERERVAPR